jgi:nucleoside-diphosphate-sugar epimerase
MRYLVTGSQGFTGRYVVAEILRSDPDARIIGIGRSAASTDFFTHTVRWKEAARPAPLPRELRAPDPRCYRYITCELIPGVDLDGTVTAADPQVVIHLAAALRDDDAPVLIVGSSGSVTGLPESLPIREDQRCAPVEPYAASKLAAEYVARVLACAAEIPTMWARIFNIAGPGQEERHVCGRFASQATAIRLGHTPATIEVGDLRPTRDFIDVRDVARALVLLAACGRPGETYNVASGREISIGDILNKTLALAHIDGDTAIVERYARAADIPRAYADITKLAGLGYAPAFSIETTLADILQYYFQFETDAGDRTSRTTSESSWAPTAAPSSHG